MGRKPMGWLKRIFGGNDTVVTLSLQRSERQEEPSSNARQGTISSVGPDKLDAVIRAIREGTGEEARRLIEGGTVDINSRGPGGLTLLCYAAGAKGKWRVAEWMIQRGADVTLSSSKKQTPLHLAAAYGNLETARLLLEGGATVNAL